MQTLLARQIFPRIRHTKSIDFSTSPKRMLIDLITGFSYFHGIASLLS